MATLIGHRLQRFTEPGSLGLVRDTAYWLCHWPQLDRPTALFADGSGAIRVYGPPTPRNVVFPPDTEFPPVAFDALYPAEQAVLATGRRRGVVNLDDELAAIWLAAYEQAAAALPPHAAREPTLSGCHFLRHREVTERKVVGRSGLETKQDVEQFVATLSVDEVADLIAGKVDEAELRAAKVFVSVADSARTMDGAEIAAKIRALR